MRNAQPQAYKLQDRLPPGSVMFCSIPFQLDKRQTQLLWGCLHTTILALPELSSIQSEHESQSECVVYTCTQRLTTCGLGMGA